MGVGYDGVDVAAAKQRGIVVTHTPDVLNDDVADLAIGLMLACARQLPQADRLLSSLLADPNRPFGHRYASETDLQAGDVVSPLALPGATIAVDDLLPP